MERGRDSCAQSHAQTVLPRNGGRMSDFLSNLAFRGLEPAPVIQPRLPSLFEPTPVHALPFAPPPQIWGESAPEAVTVDAEQRARRTSPQLPAEQPYAVRQPEPDPFTAQKRSGRPDLMLP